MAMANLHGIRALALIACAAMLAGCSNSLSETGGIRKAIGLTANPPDEFMVVSKAPLIMPPDMQLRPPRHGAEPIGQSDPRALARSSITGGAAGGAAAPAGASAGEQAILARANAGAADAAVREELLREEGIVTRDQLPLDRLLGRAPEGEEALNPYDEANRLRRDQPPAQPVEAAPGAEARQGEAGGQPTSILLEDILGSGSATN
jgi:hypothetical protein